MNSQSMIENTGGTNGNRCTERLVLLQAQTY